jgi:RHH-type rel operon transcriptional repressor/antitoxin RelB
MDTTVTVRLSNDDKNLITSYAQTKGVSVSDLVREAVLERIEDEIDLELYRQAMDEFRKNPVTYSFEEVAKDIGLEL